MSEFWKRKMKTAFEKIDVDKDGLITLKDFHAMAEKLILAQKLDQERGNRLKTSLTAIHEKFYADAAEDKEFNRDACIEATIKHYKTKEYLSLSSDKYSLYFAAIDANEDGIIQEDEFISFFNALGIDSDSAKVTFRSLDLNHDGLVSREEYIAAGLDFLTNDNDEANPSKLFWGPLVE